MAEETIKIFVHPLAIMGIADHYIRDLQQFGARHVAGAVFGRQDGRGIHALEVMGILIKRHNQDSEARLELDFESFEAEMKIYNEAYPMELLGWYTTDAAPSPTHLAVHQRFKAYTESPIFFLLDPSSIGRSGQDDDLGLIVCTEESSNVSSALMTVAASSGLDGDARTLGTRFIRHKYLIDQDDAERIAVGCALGSQMTAQEDLALGRVRYEWQGSFILLRERVQRVRNFVQQAALGTLQPPPSRALLRQAKALCSCLPEPPSRGLQNELSADLAHATHLALLATLLKSKFI